MTEAHKKTDSRPVILITGSSGFIGRRLSIRLAETFEVVGFDRPGGAQPPASVDQIPVDLTSTDSLNEGLKTVRHRHGHSLASVVHLAAYFDFSGEPSPRYTQVTVEGTKRLLRELHTQKMQVEQFVFSSTMLVHAPCEPGQTIDEDSPLAPRWPYPESKVETEQVIANERRNIRTAILRVAGVYDDMCHSIPLAHQIQRIHERQVTSTVFPGHISHGQSFVHLDDLIEAFVRTVERRQELPETLILLIGEPDVVSYDELQHQFGGLIHHESNWETTQIPRALAKTGAWLQDMIPLVDDPFIKPWMIDFADDHYALNISRASKLLDWHPKRALRETLPNMIAALKRAPEKWYREHGLITHASRPSVPPDWSYNPSSWSERLWIAAVAAVGMLVSGYLAFYQWGVLEDVWEPFFGHGSEQVLNSFLSRLLPIPDAALGAAAYLIDVVTGLIGGRERWRTMPWMVLLFGLAVGPLGLVSVLLVIAQPVLLHAWCTLCLFSALVSLVIIGPAMDEVLASLQYLRRCYERRLSLWEAFWGSPQQV